MDVRTANIILIILTIIYIFIFLFAILIEQISIFFIMLVLVSPYVIYILVKRDKAIEEEKEFEELRKKIRAEQDKEDEKDENELDEVEQKVVDIISKNIKIGTPTLSEETSQIDNSYMPIKKLDDKIRFYTEEDYNTTDITKIFYDVNGSGGVLVGNIRERVKQELNSINKFIREAQDMRIPVKPFFNIDIDKVIFDLPNENQDQVMNYTHFIKEGLTKTGKEPKYPYRLFFRTVEYVWIESDGIFSTKRYDTIHGDLHYLENQTIGKAWFVMRKQKNAYKIELKLIDNILSLGKIEYSTPDHQYYETLYKSEDKK